MIRIRDTYKIIETANDDAGFAVTIKNHAFAFFHIKRFCQYFSSEQ